MGDIQVKKLPARVESLHRAAPDVMIMTLKLPTSERLQFLAGQYIDILLKDGRRRSFSLANPPHSDAFIELHIRHVPGGQFTDHVFGPMKVRDILRFEGPLGTFFLREDSNKPIIFLAGGTGFAPIKSIIEHSLHQGLTRPMTLYWGARDEAGLYLRALAEQWAREVPGFRFVPVLSEAQWGGRQGLVHEAVMADHPDLSGFEVYACGAPAMIEAARRDFVARCVLPADAFFADVFAYAADGKGDEKGA
jgi:CDP-4-dehydro-6-deoxyglucose reductase